MISLDTAKQLKTSGLNWEPQAGDSFLVNWPPWTSREVHDVIVSNSGFLKQLGMVAGSKGIYPQDSIFWSPPLDTMLNRVQQMRLSWQLQSDTFIVYNHRGINNPRLLQVKSETQEQAVAEGLAWLLQQEKPIQPSRILGTLKAGVRSAARVLNGNWAWLVGSLALAFANHSAGREK